MAAMTTALAGLGGALLAWLRWCGRHASWVLAVGSVGALFTPELAAATRPALPVVLAGLFMFAMARIDLPAVARRALSPRRFLRTLALTLAMLAATPVVLYGFGLGFGLSADSVKALVYTGAAPPIGSAAGFCFLLGLDAAIALELTVFANLLAPLIGPVVVKLLLGDEVPIAVLELSARLAMIIGGGLMAAIILRATVGPRRIAENKSVFDGLGALGMLCFIVTLFDGVGAQIQAAPWVALSVLGLAAAANFGVQAVAALVAARLSPGPVAGAVGVAWGNRTVAIYVAALPPDPIFALFVALYQFPIYFTPLLLRRPLYGRLRQLESDAS